MLLVLFGGDFPAGGIGAYTAKMSPIVLGRISARDIRGRHTSVTRLSAARVRRTAEHILKKTPLCAIATVGPDGRPHINTAYFAWSAAFELFFLSYPGSQHCRNLRERPRVAIAVFDSTQTWGALDRGLQLFGTCREAHGPAGASAKRTYARRFRAYGDWMAGLAPRDAANEYRFYRFVTRRLKLFDEREFGSAVFVTARLRHSDGKGPVK